MEESKKLPFLPPNFVTLAQLQERWLKDQEQKQKQKEIEEEEDRKKKQQQQQQQNERRRGNGVNSRRTENRDTRGEKSRSNQSQKNQSEINQSEKNRRTGELGESKLVDAAIVLGEGSINVADSKKKSRKYRKNRKTRAQENLSEGTAQLQQDKDSEGGNLAIVTQRNTDKVTFRGNGKYLEKKIAVDRMKLKFDDLTLNNGGKLGEDESVMQNTRGGRRFGYRGGSWKFSPRNPRNPNLVWVKKGEISDADATGI